MEFAVYNTQGKETGKKVKLEKEVFGIEPNEHAVYLDVKQFMANKRQGTHKAKARADVSYSTRKIKRQKGTGTARAGSLRSPIFVGGGTAFGPEPRDYGFKVNKKVKRLARKSALSTKAQAKNLKVLEDFQLDAPKTSSFVDILKGLELSGTKTLFVANGENENLILSSRNVPKTKVVSVDSLNTYDIMNAAVLIICEGALDKINEVLK
ncbi:MAG: 50S ribosomal protein L4 [Flavobacteriales bacterium]|jgi:large subunit ribosomal protein L4|nr:50S ribosomal protein L4 [Flavobacteriales bacterium]NCG30606.1 50S ribosomal protein L4 [Bacteroidota bacterium]MBT3963957.1 50S ribosomal protein L4 [Flavobacteriales bacterium]MBT4704884.1 50S ribosomal protein L4 [Flavobacteriales bacterium]MBT4929659.1 50S ribosomal protein L4 [Flavobacteriales bacterium]